MWVPQCWRVWWLDADWVLPVYTGVMITSCWCHPYPGLACGSGRLVFGSGQLIRVKKTCVTRGACLCAWALSLLARDGAFCRFRRPISTRFLTVASSFPPLHNGMVKTQFWQLLFLSKIKHPFNHVLWYQLLGIPTGGVLIFAQQRLSTLTQYFTWFSKSPTTMGESPYYLDIRERIQ